MNRAVSFTHVRNPWDRIRSTYEDRIATARTRLRHSDDPDKIVNFAEFLSYVEQYPRGDAHWVSFSQRCSTSPDSDGRVFKYDHVIRFEDGLQEGLQTVFEDANLTLPELKSLYRNATKHTLQDRIEYYRASAATATTATKNVSVEDLIAAVGRIYKDDIRQFGYSFYKYD